MKIARWLTGAAFLLFLIGSSPAFAEPMMVEQSTKTEDTTTVTWDSCFEILEYKLGEPITLVVNWTVDEGAATFNGFSLRGPGFTPKGPDPATGELSLVQTVMDSGAIDSTGSVEVTFTFDALHCDEGNGVRIGNAHFWLLLNVDTVDDGTTETDSVVGYGVNVHVEQPGECTSEAGGPPADVGRPESAGPASRGRP